MTRPVDDVCIWKANFDWVLFVANPLDFQRNVFVGKYYVTGRM